MKNKFLWKPSPATRLLLAFGLIALIHLIAYLHYITGFAYEFNVFYSLPVLAASWLLGDISCAIVAIICLADWAFSDIKLAGEQSKVMAIVFNTTTRALTIFFVIVLMRKLRQTMQDEWDASRKDQLTGLYNRRYFYEISLKVLEIIRRQSLPVSIAFMDLDHFKEVNDSLGHSAGDALLQVVSKIMQAHFRAEDVLARLGGDEFAVIMPGIKAEDAISRLENLRSSILAAMREHRWPVTVSIGAAAFVTVKNSIDPMLAIADEAMYEAKRAGRDTIVLRTSP
ncbi:GGDEF domain-containing protein [Desulfovibrio sp. TomC]|uniref:GGDEF domain-containing protein n=1 Tax=Desulfovibrio sp. TomC TaxID=1562888 RepID=UPI0005BB68F2|nr:GGDEF domain-containing protein [Desulfovibrio sp. TomC]